MVFKSFCDSRPVAVATCLAATWGWPAEQDHPAYIPRVLRRVRARLSGNGGWGSPIRTRSDQSVTSGAFLSAVLARPGNREVDRSGGSHSHSALATAAPWSSSSLRDRPHAAGDGPRPVRAGSGPAPWSLTGVPAEVSRIKHDFACTFAAPSTCVRCPAATVMLDAGGAGTYTQRAIPGSEPRLGSCA